MDKLPVIDDSQPLWGKPPGLSPTQFDLEEALRQLLGGAPHPRETEPSGIPLANSDSRPPERRWDQVQFQRQPALPHELQEEETGPFETLTDPRSGLPHTFGQERVIRCEESKQPEKAARRFEQLSEQAKPATRVLSAEHTRHFRTGARTIALVRDARTVRQALIASLVFGFPKAFEGERL